jgi:hypothetical protein
MHQMCCWEVKNTALRQTFDPLDVSLRKWPMVDHWWRGLVKKISWIASFACWEHPICKTFQE